MATITKLPIDFKGTLATNLFTGEEHTLNKATGRVNRMFTPDFGAFYTESLVVRDSTGKALVRDTDYVVTYYYKELGELTAKEICAIIVITNPLVTNVVRITYQAFGGPYALSIKELKAVLDASEEAPGKVKWEDIVDKPLQYSPSDHEHEYWQLYGLESTNYNLEQLGRAWAGGRKAIIGDNDIYYQNYIQLAQQALESYRLKVWAHIQDIDNPHDTDKFKIQLGNVNNWPMADLEQSTDKTINNVYQPIGGIYNQLETHVRPLLLEHIGDKDNPHQVLLTDPLLNLYSAQEIIDIFAERLRRDGIAVDSENFAGLPEATVRANIRSALDVSNVNPATRFSQFQFAPPIANWDVTQYALSGGQKFIPFVDALREHNDTAGAVYFVGSSGSVTSIQSAYNAIYAFGNRPEISNGTWVIGQYAQDFVGGHYNTALVIGQKRNGAMVILMAQ